MAESRVTVVAAGLLWVLLCVRWFDAAAPFRPAALAAIPPSLLAVALLGALAAGAVARRRGRGRAGSPDAPRARDPGLLLVVALAVLFRLPMAWQGAAGYVTADGALSGLMALDVRDGREHAVFVPHVPYSGSLKAHLTAPLAAALDPARAFALVSVLFYAAFVAAVYRLAQATAGSEPAAAPRASPGAVAAGLYAAFSPAFVTRYSLSNDGNYVEVLALGTWALVLALRWADGPDGRARRAFAIGLLLGLAFWCHILAVIPAAAVALFLLVESPRRALTTAPWMALGFAIGDCPGLVWNAAHHWDSFAYLRPGAVHGAATVGAAPGPAFLAKAHSLVTDHLVVLLGYDFGYPRVVDQALILAAVVALAGVAIGVVRVLRRARGGAGRAGRLVLLFLAVNLAVALLALPYIAGNPRYLLFSMAVVPVLLAEALPGRAGRVAFAVLVAVNALASLAQAVPTVAADQHWRSFVRGLQADGVRWCYTDFYLATKVNFLSGESITCSAKLGPTTTEYFFRFRDEVESAPSAALVAVNATAADKLARRLDRLGVAYERQDLMKPVLFGLSRKVDPAELFPDREFPRR